MKVTKQRERKGRIMSLKYFLLSLLALFVVSLLILKNYETWTLPIEVVPEKGTAKKTAEKTRIHNSRWTERPTFKESYNLVYEKNIFHPKERNFNPGNPGGY